MDWQKRCGEDEVSEQTLTQQAYDIRVALLAMNKSVKSEHRRIVPDIGTTESMLSDGISRGEIVAWATTGREPRGGGK